MNLAIKTSISKKHGIIPTEDDLKDDSDGLSGNSATVKEALQTIAHIHTQFNKYVKPKFLTRYRSKDGLKEIYMRTRKDSWVVGKLFGEREFYIIFDQKYYSLMEVQGMILFFNLTLQNKCTR